MYTFCPFHRTHSGYRPWKSLCPQWGAHGRMLVHWRWLDVVQRHLQWKKKGCCCWLEGDGGEKLRACSADIEPARWGKRSGMRSWEDLRVATSRDWIGLQFDFDRNTWNLSSWCCFGGNKGHQLNADHNRVHSHKWNHGILDTMDVATTYDCYILLASVLHHFFSLCGEVLDSSTKLANSDSHLLAY